VLVVPASQEAVGRRINVQGQSGKKQETLPEKYIKQKGLEVWFKR
jgi:hypothetical protein